MSWVTGSQDGAQIKKSPMIKNEGPGTQNGGTICGEARLGHEVTLVKCIPGARAGDIEMLGSTTEFVHCEIHSELCETAGAIVL